MTTTQPGVDLSFSLLSQAQIRWLWDQGVRRIVHDLWTGGYVPRAPDGTLVPVHNIQAVLDSGLALAQDGYIVVDDRMGSGNGAWHVDHARVALSDLHWRTLERGWIDVEVDDPRFNGTTFPTVRSGVERVVALGKTTRDIYTRRSFWAQIGDSAEFSDCGFWLANYDGNPDPMAGFTPFPSCGLANYRGKQYHNTSDAAGLKVDLDTFIVEEASMDDDLRRWMKAAGIYLHAASDVLQWGRVAAPGLRGALLFLVGPGAATTPATKEQARGVLEYAAALAAEMTPPVEAAKQLIRALAQGAQL